MKGHFKTLILAVLMLVTVNSVSFAEDKSSIQSVSSINWITRDFTSRLTMNTEKAKITMPSGKKSASAKIKAKMPQLIQPPLLSLFADSNSYLSDMVITEQITLDQIYNFITGGYKTPDVFSPDAKELNTTNYLNIKELNKELVQTKFASKPERTIEMIPSRQYTGIIIDARGALHIHGEYIDSQTYPCLFPKIWDEDMNLVYEKNYAKPEIIKKDGLAGYHYSDDISNYEDRVGPDPLYIRAKEVFGRNRTDPIIKHKDALKILTVPENVELLANGRVIILLDKENLIYDIKSSQKDQTYYVVYDEVKQYFYENKVPGLTIDNTKDGILFSVDLKFYPDSDILLPGEEERIDFVAKKIKEFLDLEGYTILVEGHTADVGKPNGQLNLSIDRAIAVMTSLINQGIDESLFTYKAYGGTMPIASNATEEGRAQNRRVDITLRPKQTYILRDWL
ncbi:MAG: OmpA family protein [Treponema sp.]|nr:OmpA family protein [Treponema sp.]